MGYFDDIEFIDGAAKPRCLARLNRRFPETFSLEFLHSGRMYCGIDGGPRAILERPCVFWHHPAHRYDYGATGAEGWDHHWLLMRGERPRRMLEESLMPLFPSGCAFLREPELFNEEFHSLLELALSPELSRRHEAVALLERMLARILRLAAPASEDGTRERPFEALLETICLNPLKDYDFEALAASFGLSYGHFRRRFRELSGRAPKECLLHARMRLAAEMLRSPDRQVKEVALALGYKDPAQFTKMFKSRTGVSPEAYRRCLPR